MPVSKEVESLIEGRKLMAHLATSTDDRPHVAPVWYHYEDGSVYVTTGGRKLDNVRRNPRVAVSIQEDDDGDAEWMAALRGTAREVTDPDRVREIAGRLFATYLGTDRDQWDDYYRDVVETGETEGAMLEIRVGSATGQEY